MKDETKKEIRLEDLDKVSGGWGVHTNYKCPDCGGDMVLVSLHEPPMCVDCGYFLE